jgi:hypothetical protein
MALVVVVLLTLLELQVLVAAQVVHQTVVLQVMERLILAAVAVVL